VIFVVHCWGHTNLIFSSLDLLAPIFPEWLNSKCYWRHKKCVSVIEGHSYCLWKCGCRSIGFDTKVNGSVVLQCIWRSWIIMTQVSDWITVILHATWIHSLLSTKANIVYPLKVGDVIIANHLIHSIIAWPQFLLYS
jgi:hypothetical protein